METKPYVRVLLKKGVSKGSELGFEIETLADAETSQEALIAMGEKAIAVNKELMQKAIL